MLANNLNAYASERKKWINVQLENVAILNSVRMV